MTEDEERRLIAEHAALNHIVEMLLTRTLRSLPEQDAENYKLLLVESSVSFRAMKGVARGDEFAAEKLSDRAVSIREHVAEIVSRASARAEKANRF